MSRDLVFSIDLEDARDHAEDGHVYPERVLGNTESYLEFLRKHGVTATFFVVGRVAERHPGLIRDIVAEGHEVACHTHTHLQLDRHTPASLADDLNRNLDALHRCGANDVTGFRAPTFSMTEETQWVYAVLGRLGFEYSSSVLPARNPLYGWPQFGSEPRMMGEVLEIPITVHPSFMVPIAGGVYFRVLPFFLIQRSTRALAGQGQTIHGYFHPHDIDVEQERFMHEDLSGNRFYNALMYYGRSRVFARLEQMLDICKFTNYREYLDRCRN